MAAGAAPTFRMLGPLEVWIGRREIDLGGARQRALLALLLLHRGQVVPAEQLAEELWSGGAPAGAAKTLQVYVSRLRRALGADVVTTRGGGYVLAPDASDVDADRFEALLAEGRERLAAGDGSSAARVLREALALWRGPALADLRYETFAQAEIARLEEARLAALEERIEADLMRRRHSEVVPELDRLVREHPLRERLRGLQMRALYGTGRQAEALDAYRAARQALVEELGIEPGPELRDLERRILEQDPALGVPARPRPAVAAPRRGALALAAGGALLVAAGIGAIVVALSSGGTKATLRTAAPDSLAVIDPGRAALVADIPTGSGPTGVAVGAGSVWVANAGDQTLARVDPASDEVTGRIGLGRIPSRLAFGDGALWVASALGDRGVVLRVDPGSETVTGRSNVRVGVPGLDYFAPPTPSALAVGPGGVWANSGHAHLTVVGLAKRLRAFNLGAQHAVDGIAIGAGGVWVASGPDDRVLRLDVRTGRVVAEIPIAATPKARFASPYSLAIGYGSVWVTDALSGTVSRIDPHFNAVRATIAVGRRPTRVAVGAGGVWVLAAGDGTVERIDPRSNSVTARVGVGPDASDIAAGAGRVWVTVAGGAPRVGASRLPSRAVPLTVPACSQVVHGAGRPQLLIVSDLPTYAGPAERQPLIADARAAVRLVLREHQFRAGRFRIGYQECDSSTRPEGPSPRRCAENARAYALDPSLVGVIGPYNSFCAEVQLPTLDAAAGGPVAVISPTNTYVGLTRAGPSTAADEPDRYYPAGVRNYARLTAPDDEQSAAVDTFLHELGRHRLYLLDDDEPTGFAGATYAAQAAHGADLTVVGHAVWHARRGGYRSLARRIARSGADSVLLSGCNCTDGARLVADLRAVLGSRATLIGTDNFTSGGPAHRAFDGIFITTAGRPAEALPGARGLLSRVAPRRPLTQLDPSTAYAAEATEVLLHAIAASDGSRASVTRALLATRLRTSLIGPVAFDRTGDPVPAPFAVYRMDSRAAGPRGHRGVAGEVLDRMVEPAPRLVR